MPEEEFSGAAPEADLLIVKLKPAKEYLRELYLIPPKEAEVFQEDDIMLGISFAVKFATENRRPLSVCLGLGTSQGSHRGESPLCQTDRQHFQSPVRTPYPQRRETRGLSRHHYTEMLDSSRTADEIELRVGGEESQKRIFHGILGEIHPELYSLSSGIAYRGETGGYSYGSEIRNTGAFFCVRGDKKYR